MRCKSASAARPCILAGVRYQPEPDWILATVMFTEVVGATEKATALGDRRWRDLRDQYHALVRRQLVRFRGSEIDAAGDSFLATFDGPARGIRCACSGCGRVRFDPRS